jgi:hypothetical protein
MEHPPYSPDLAPQRFPYVWPNERSCTRKKIFTGVVQNWLKMQPKNFFSDGIKKKLVKLWNRCVEVERDYVQK